MAKVTEITPPAQPIGAIDIAEELSTSFVDYSMSVIVSRALPDVRDGLKPVHRRILYAMHDGGFTHDKPFRKSARVVGDVMGKYHPHGDSAIYDAMVRMAQAFSMSVPLIDGQGNYGSMDGDRPAAMRYTETRLHRAANLLLADIEKDTASWRPNYDGSLSEPEMLPAAFPNLLVNGSEGIAVGMATKIPPHNPTEAIAAVIALIDNPALDASTLNEIVQGPDFPTGGIIVGKAGIRQAYETGKGSITLRARHHLETDKKGNRSIVVTEMPYQINKADLVARIAELHKEKKIEGISEVRDESDREGVRVVIDLKKDCNEDVLMARLHSLTNLQISFPANMLAIHNGRPIQFTLKGMLEAFIEFRRDVIYRRTAYDLGKARERIHGRAGLLAALANIDAIIKIIRAAADTAAARDGLTAKAFGIDDDLAELIARADPRSDVSGAKSKQRMKLTEAQASAILELKLHRLTGLERDKLTAEARELAQTIARYLEILGTPAELTAVMREELVAASEKLACARRTSIEEGAADYAIEDLIPREDMVVVFTHHGYAKRVPLTAYKSQARGGKGKTGMDTKDDDFVTRVMTASTHTSILLFTERGQAYKVKVHELPQGGPESRGRPIVNVIPSLSKDDRIASILELPEDEASWGEISIAFATASGQVRRNTLDDFKQVRSNGKLAMKLTDADGNLVDRLVNVMLAGKGDDIMMTTRMGMVMRFPLDDVRIFTGRESTGVRGIKLNQGDAVISAVILGHVEVTPAEIEGYLRRSVKSEDGDGAGEDAAELSETRIAELEADERFVLTVSENGFGKRTSTIAYRAIGRGGKGFQDKSKAAKIGELVGSCLVDPSDDLVLITDAGQTIRIPADSVRITRRSASGVRLINLAKGEKVVSVATAPRAEEPAQDFIEEVTK